MNKQWKDLFAPQLKFLDEGNGMFAGYASTSGNVDSGGDIVVKGAFQQTIPAFLKDGFIALGHDWNGLQIGYPTTAREDDHGLWVEGEFHSTPEAQNARTVMRERMAAGKSVGLSIGYGAAPSGIEYRDDGVRLLKSIDLFEVSMVTVPMNAMAGVAGAKDAAADPVAAFIASLRALDLDPAALGAALSYAEHLELVAALADVLVSESKAIEGRSAERLAVRRKEVERGQRKAGAMFSGRNRDTLNQHADVLDNHASALQDVAKGIRDLVAGDCEGADCMTADNRPADDVVPQPKPKAADVAAWVAALRTDLLVRHGVTV